MKKGTLLIFLFLLNTLLFAQSEEAMDILYSKDDADTVYTALIALQISGNLASDATVEDAVSFLEGNKWGKKVLKDGNYLTKGGFSLMVMELFDLPRGVMYRIIPGKRYALREMMHMNYILGNPYVNDTISTFDVIYTLSSLEPSKGKVFIEEEVLEKVDFEEGDIEETFLGNS